jgi:hypothetical protein
MTLTTSEKLGVDFTGCEETPERQAAIDAIKDQLLEKLASDPVPEAAPVVVATGIDDAAAVVRDALGGPTAGQADAESPTAEAAAPATASVTAAAATGAVTRKKARTSAWATGSTAMTDCMWRDSWAGQPRLPRPRIVAHRRRPACPREPPEGTASRAGRPPSAGASTQAGSCPTTWVACWSYASQPPSATITEPVT